MVVNTLYKQTDTLTINEEIYNQKEAASNIHTFTTEVAFLM